jgi:hypothetical protein
VRQGLLRSGLVVVVVAVGMVGESELSGSPAQGAARAACRGPAELDNYLGLASGRKISIRRVTCGAAQTVVKRFAARCVGAYTSQGTCRIRTSKRWRCTSTIVGSALRGAPSSVGCAARRSRVRFTVKLSESTIARPPGGGITTAAPAFPWSGSCIDSNASGEMVPPPGPPNDTFAIHVYGTVPLLVGEAVQDELVGHNVGKRLVDGLGVRPRGFPRLAPVFLRKGPPQGIAWSLCGTTTNDGAVVEIGDTVQIAAKVAAHELFHVHSFGIAVSPVYPWFDDSAAEWSTWKAGLLKGPTPFEVNLQYPGYAVDTLDPEGYRYAMWRFVQFLDDKGLVTAGGGWPLIRSVLAGGPAYASALNQFLISRQTTLGAELAAFWGEHLKQKPRRPPHLEPAGSNSEQVRVRAGDDTYTAPAGGLRTKLIDFKLANDVKRVEFEFQAPADGYFWGLTAPNESSRFEDGDSVSFCVGKANDDDLEWPGHFPVTFTNGIVGGNALLGTVRIFAQTDAEQCGGQSNRACTVLAGAGARGLLGPDAPDIGGFAGHGGVEHGRPYVFCAYKGMEGVASLQIDRWRSSKQLRRWIRRKGKSPGWRTLKQGDAGVVLEAGTHTFIDLAVGRQKLFVGVTAQGGGTSPALRIANEAVPLIR